MLQLLGWFSICSDGNVFTLKCLIWLGEFKNTENVTTTELKATDPSYNDSSPLIYLINSINNLL